MATDSVAESLQQLIALQSQQLNAIHTLVGNSRMNGAGAPNAQFNGTYSSQGPNYLSGAYNPFNAGGRPGIQTVQGAANPGLIGSFFVNQSQIPYQTQQMRGVEFGNRAYNAFLNGVSGFASAGGSAAGSALAGGGLVGGLVGGMAGGAVVGSLFAVGIDQAKQAQAYNSYLLQNSSRFINAGESINERGPAGFSTAQRIGAAQFLRNFNTTAKISDADTMQLLQGFTEGGLMRDVSNLQSFQNKFSQLTKYVKQASLSLNASYKEVTQMMSDLEKQGVSTNNFNWLASKAKITGSYTGLSATQQLQTAVNMAGGLTSGTGISMAQTIGNVSDITTYVSTMFDQAKATNNAALMSMIGNFGGQNGAAQAVAAKQQQLLQNKSISSFGILFSDYDSKTGQFTINTSAREKIMSGNYSTAELAQMASDKMNGMIRSGNTAGVDAWNNFGWQTLAGMDTGAQQQYISTVLGAMQRTSGIQGNMTDAQRISMFLGDKSYEAQLYGAVSDAMGADNGALIKSTAQAASRQNMVDYMNSIRTGPGYGVINAWEGFKDIVGMPFAAGAAAATSMGQGITDWFYGRKYGAADFQGAAYSGIDQSLSGLARTVENVSEALSKLPGASESVKQSFERASGALGGSGASGASSVQLTKYDRSMMSQLFSATSFNYTDPATRFNSFFGNADLMSNRMAVKIGDDPYKAFAGVLGMPYDYTSESTTKIGTAVDAKYRALKAEMGTSEWAKKSTMEKAQDYQMLAAINGNFGDKFGYSSDDLNVSNYAFSATDIQNMKNSGVNVRGDKVTVDDVNNFLGAAYGSEGYSKLIPGAKKGDSLDKLISGVKAEVGKTDASRTRANEALIAAANSFGDEKVRNAILSKDTATITSYLADKNISATNKATLQGVLSNIGILGSDASSLAGSVTELEAFKNSANLFGQVGAVFAAKAGHQGGLLGIDTAKDSVETIQYNMQANRDTMSSWLFQMNDDQRNSLVQSLGISDEAQQDIISTMNGAKESGSGIDVQEMSDIVDKIMSSMANTMTGDGMVVGPDGTSVGDIPGAMNSNRDTLIQIMKELANDQAAYERALTEHTGRKWGEAPTSPQAGGVGLPWW